VKRYRYRSEKPVKLFQGETMVCYLCGKIVKSDPHIESGWTAIQLDQIIHYICPECFANPPAGADMSAGWQP